MMGMFDVLEVIRRKPNKWWTVRETSLAMGYPGYSNRVNKALERARHWKMVHYKEKHQGYSIGYLYRYKKLKVK